MRAEYFSYGLLAALAIALLVAAFTDLKRRRIDNKLNAAIALAAPLFWIASGYGLVEVGYQLATALAAFVVFAAVFALRMMGGGDVKLLTAIALWIEPLWFLRLLLVMAVIGGLLTLAFGAWHIARRRRDKIAIPYGVAIATAGIWALASQYLPLAQASAKVG